MKLVIGAFIFAVCCLATAFGELSVEDPTVVSRAEWALDVINTMYRHEPGKYSLVSIRKVEENIPYPVVWILVLKKEATKECKFYVPVPYVPVPKDADDVKCTSMPADFKNGAKRGEVPADDTDSLLPDHAKIAAEYGVTYYNQKYPKLRSPYALDKILYFNYFKKDNLILVTYFMKNKRERQQCSIVLKSFFPFVKSLKSDKDLVKFHCQPVYYQ